MARVNKLNKYLDDIHDAMHSHNLNTHDFLELVVNILTDFSHRMDAGEFRFEPSEPVMTTVGPAVTAAESASLIPLANTASQRAAEVDPASLHTPTPAEAIEAAQPSLTATAAYVSDAAAVSNDHWQDWDVGPAATITTAISVTPLPASALDAQPQAVPLPQVAAHEVMTRATESSDVSHASDIISNNARIAVENLNGGGYDSSTPKLDASNAYKQTFDNGLGDFSHVWGDVKVHDGYIELTSSAATHENASAMIHPNGANSGFGYGFYSFTLSTSSNTVGPYALLWPATDRWPGPEIDVFELGGSKGETLGKPYSTMHWNDNGNDGYEWHVMPNGIDPTQVHTYSVDWQADTLTFYVDGKSYNTITDNVPKDFAHGGENAAPGVGQLTGWWQDQNLVDNVMKLYEFNFIPHSDNALS